MAWLLVLIPSFFAALVQGITGFGSVIIMMVFFPAVFPIARAAGIGGVIMLCSTIVLAWHYRHAFSLRKVAIPFVVYAAVATWSVHLGTVLDAGLLRKLLGGLLIALSIYFIFSKTAGEHPYPWFIAGAFMIISGFFNGLFGIGGPLMALYFLSMAETTPQYMGNLQGFFLMDTFYITAVRIHSGILVAANLPLILGGMAAAVVGTLVAAQLSARWELKQVKPFIYAFIGLSGLYYLIF
ncbi:sulfite exporter TauE/SafE family protein [Lacticaseibacillus mingshuiensis]|uniref:Probable membrane transporter protein n=1 Tax=Lacticaseibacillus mingshuiensis TaxID=2799574 RepID=A0ABW4CEY8_9LACO|nr:sulfite exporter TauE/SafE family protein [Lacticaseibacillus mingshuiensis]